MTCIAETTFTNRRSLVTVVNAYYYYALTTELWLAEIFVITLFVKAVSEILASMVL